MIRARLPRFSLEFLRGVRPIPAARRALLEQRKQTVRGGDLALRIGRSIVAPLATALSRCRRNGASHCNRGWGSVSVL